MDNKYAQNYESRKYMLSLKTFCNKIKPFVTYYKRLINSYNNTVHNILEKEKNYCYLQLKENKNEELSPH